MITAFLGLEDARDEKITAFLGAVEKLRRRHELNAWLRPMRGSHSMRSRPMHGAKPYRPRAAQPLDPTARRARRR